MQIEIGKNIMSFSRCDVFQSGIMSLISGLYSDSSDLVELDKMFKLIDKD
jgi:hypothetical protein